MKKKSQKRPSISSFLESFTLIELMVVVSIMVLLTAIILPNYNNTKKDLALERSANLLLQHLRDALEKAMSAAEYGGIIPAGGYGMYLSSSEIFLFADCPLVDHLYTPGNQCAPGFPEKIVAEKIELEPGVQIKSLSPASPLNISFQPPDPTVFINGLENAGEAKIVLSLTSNPSRTKTITVKQSGLIAIE